MPVREWDGASYDRISSAMERLGLGVLDRLTLQGGETVLDAGCGSGRVTEALLDRLPRGRVIAFDGSASMLDAARRRLAGRQRVELVEGDLLELELPEPIDVVFSTATFHWIVDHARLFARLHAALRPGGRLEAQCGGEGNVELLHEVTGRVNAQAPYAEYLAGWQRPQYFSPADLARERLLAAGFREVESWLQPAPVVPEEPHEYLRTIVLGGQAQQLPPELRDRYIDAVIAEAPTPLTVDYVRLNLQATA